MLKYPVNLQCPVYLPKLRLEQNNVLRSFLVVFFFFFFISDYLIQSFSGVCVLCCLNHPTLFCLFFSQKKKKFPFTFFVGLHHSFAGSIMATLLFPAEFMSYFLSSADGFFPDPFKAVTPQRHFPTSAHLTRSIFYLLS